MATNKKKDSITVANIMAIFGLVALLVFTYLGHSYMSGGEIGWDIAIAVIITSFAAFLLWFMVKAKEAENNLDKWRIIEYATLAFYIVTVIPLSAAFGIMHFFVVNDKKEEIKELAQSDLNKIEEMFTDYKDFESGALSVTGTGLRTATDAGQVCDEQLNKFMADNNISHTHESANNFENIQRTTLIGAGFETFYQSYLDQKSEIEGVINGWSLIQVPRKARSIEELAKSAEEELTRLSNDAQLPIIAVQNNKHTITGFQKKDFKIRDGIKSFQFKKALKKAKGFSITATLVLLLIHALILFNYIVAHRALTLGVSKRVEEDGGRSL
ncbi:MAG: hypothetical protein IJ527_07170 [Prevotella sp.]|nr:hypothetical protein [Prevotella sp.]